MVLAQQGQEWPESTLLEDVIPALWAVSSNVSESPDRLFPHIVDTGRKQPNEFRDSTGADNGLSVVGGARRDICERPGGFELQNTRLKPSSDQNFCDGAHLKHGVVATEEFHKPRDNTALNDAFNGRVLLLRE